ncbi:structural maintenance of chromosomes protein 6 [Nematocida sp. LUAm3]|nr:structural maintenance of chromosomes protein 6 [Nematocida sp. LUAm3]KAI5174743.1 structural maintenance of chromosomes protein 6 [Nematocida sp. LUAm2]KAI5177846.1 structural maintenance of chromosomes protein 6 [Nematocida sp. LUAm1]
MIESWVFLKNMQLVNFLCHENLMVDFDKKVTCIVGANGSGKSAIMIGIGALFGAKAGSMDRGRSIKQFIKTGEPAAILRARIANRDYHVDKYGEEILIEKHISLDGSARLKIIGASGVSVGRTQEDLNILMQHYRINLQSPVCFLTQDHAKKILRAATPKSFYKFFKEGTDIEDVQLIHTRDQSSISEMKKSISHAQSKTETLKKSLSQVESALVLYDSLSTIGDKILALQKEKAWAHVEEKETEKNEMQRSRENAYKEYTECAKRKEEVLRGIAEIKQEIAKELEARAQEQHGRLQRESALEDHLKRERFKESEIQREIDAFIYEIERQKTNLARIQKIIGVGDGSSTENIEDFDKTKAHYEELQKKQESVQVEMETKKAQLLVDIMGKKEEIRSIENMIKIKNDIVSTAEQFNPMHYYGPSMVRALEYVRNSQIQVIGPLGLHIAVKETKWAKAIEAALGPSLYGFIVHTQNDKNELEKIFTSTGLTKYQIYLTQPHKDRVKDMILYKAKEVSSQIFSKLQRSSDAPVENSNFCTLLSQIEESDTVVVEQLIILLGIEKIGLVKDRYLGYSVLQKKAGYDAIFTCDADKIQYIGQSLSDMRCPLKDTRLFVSKENDELVRQEIIHLQEKRSEEYKVYSHLQKEADGVSKGIFEARDQNYITKQKLHELLEIKKKREAMLSDDLVIESNTLSKTIEKDCEQLSSIKETQQEIRQRITSLEKDLDLMKNSEKRGKQEDTQETKNTAYKREKESMLALQSVEDQIAAKQKEIDQYEKSIGNLENICRDLKEKSKELTNQEIQYSVRSSAEIEKELLSYESKLFVMETETENNKDLLMRKNELLSEISRLNTIVFENISTVENLEIWTKERIKIREELLKEMSEHTESSFSSLMSMRGYEGSLQFHHKTEELEIKVLTDRESLGKKGSLSGGEQSFSGICFLLSLWSLLSSPIRILDEFDVFMDSMNRKAALQLILELSRGISSQIILITPQAIPDLPKDLCNIITLTPPIK